MYDRLPLVTARAWVADLGGEPIAIAGFYLDGGVVHVFSDMKDEMRRFPVTIMRAAISLMGWISASGLPAECVADEEEANSRSFLERLGWAHVGANEYGEVYQWHS